MYKQIYDIEGNPKLIEENEDGIYEYNTDLYTEIEPPSDIYLPIHFDGEKWIGTKKEEWEQAQKKGEEVEPSEKDLVIANLTIQLLDTQTEVETLREDVASLTLKLLESE